MGPVKFWLAIVTACILTWMLAVAVTYAILTSTSYDLMGTATYVANMSPTGRDEMCEVWSQDRLAVIQSLRTLNDSTVEEAAMVARLTCM